MNIPKDRFGQNIICDWIKAGSLDRVWLTEPAGGGPLSTWAVLINTGNGVPQYTFHGVAPDTAPFTGQTGTEADLLNSIVIAS
ncbi:hypothetical protein AA309_12930 [Microvirga vignae]|uniref:Uncharacterized protein n=1 Tax=Microvirga vignae TaxID=1225564 RepID=A0A0H1RBJ1_9HYPH|nr:hypothetical protein [Microvirga vignae]KLK92605.1 hypothetical protein AA309_12930 [Microvirga vignae]